MNGYGRGEDNRNHKEGNVITRETFGMTLLLFSVILFVIAVAGQYILGEIGVAITAFLLGMFGYFVYPLLASCVYASLVLITGKKPLSGKWFLRISALVCSVFLIVHLATSARFFGNGYGAYLNGCWKAASERAGDSTGAGAVFGLVVYPIRAVLSTAGAYVLFALLTALSVFFFLWATPLKAVFTHPRNTSEKEKKPSAGDTNAQTVKSAGVREYPGAIAFDDLETAQPSYGGETGDYAQAPYTPPQMPQYAQPQTPQYEQPYRQPQAQQPYTPQYAQPEQPYTPPYEQPYGQYDAQPYEPPYEPTGRDILFSSDPAASYRSNLIFNRDSAFNSQPRRSSILPDDSPARKTDFGIPSVYERPVTKAQSSAPAQRPAPPVTPAPQPRPAPSYTPQPQQPVPPAPQAPQSYHSEYGRQAEAPRSTMPRKIVEQRPAPSDGYSLRESDLNYPQIPSYKAPEVFPEHKDRDFYANDVPTEYSSAPNVRDIPDDSLLGERNRFSEPIARDSEPVARNGFSRDSEPVARDSFSRDSEPVSRNGFSRDSEPVARNDFSRDSEPVARNDFSRGSEPVARERDKTSKTREVKRAPVNPEPEPLKTEPERSFSDRGLRQPEEAREEKESFSRKRESSEQENDFRFGDGLDPLDRGGKSDRTVGFGGRSERTVGFGNRDEIGDTTIGFGDRTEKPEAAREDTEVSFDRSSRLSDDSGSRAQDMLRRGSVSRAGMFDDDRKDETEEPSLPYTASRAQRDFEPPAQEIPSTPAPKPHKHVYKQYKYPSLELFRQYDDTIYVSQEEIFRNSDIIVETLAGFRVEAEIIKVTPGPSVTRYDIDIPRNISVRSVIKHDEEIAMRLHARDGVNIYSNSEVGAISIEVPNAKRAVVGIRSVMQADEYRNSKPGSLMFAIGKDVEGRNVCGNIPKMTHILVAGSTNSGKSVCLNAMLVSLVCKYSPEELRLILIDPKKVEFTIYDGLPHLMINEIIADAQKAVSALNWSIKEMERRYELFEQKTRSGTAVRNLDEYNAVLGPDEQKLAKIVIVVDELADLMSVAKKDIEERIQRLTQKARAAGIHLVIATQRPSVDVITGVIKGNLPTRMAFRVIQEVDSRTILDESGAEKLLGNGDMLYKTGGMFNCSRVQGAFLSSEEVQAIVEDIKANNEAYFDPDVADYINKTESGESGAQDDDDADGEVNQEYIKALAISVKLGSTSISLIQRKCSVGYNHAGKIIEWMELMGYITPFDGKAKARTVLLTKEEYESKYGSLD